MSTLKEKLKLILNKVIFFFTASKKLKERLLYIERLRDENNMLKDQSMKKRKIIEELKTTIMKLNADFSILMEKKDKASKHVATKANALKELQKRRDEFLLRLKSKIPDEVIGGRLENYKYWLAEPFIVETYFSYKPKSDSEVFIDQFAVYKKLGEIIDGKVSETDKET